MQKSPFVLAGHPRPSGSPLVLITIHEHSCTDLDTLVFAFMRVWVAGCGDTGVTGLFRRMEVGGRVAVDACLLSQRTQRHDQDIHWQTRMVVFVEL